MLLFALIYLVASFGCKEQVTSFILQADPEDISQRVDNLEEILNKFEEEYGMFIEDIVENNVDFNMPQDGLNSTEDTRILFPGTKWCGPGNRANGLNDLGFFRNVDSCCRQHDQCPDFMSPGETKYGLTNTGRFSRLLCSCDQALYDCLKGVNNLVAKEIGITYFNLLRTQCFKQEFPIINCLQYSNRFSDRCLLYNLDTTKPKVWQWFDDPVF